MVSIDPLQLPWGAPPGCTTDALGGWLKSRTPGVPHLTTRLLLLPVYFAVSSAAFGFAAIQAVIEQMMLSEGPYTNRLMFDVQKNECLEEIQRILTSLPVASTNMRYYTEIEMKALKERGLLGIIGAHITSIVKNKVRRPGASSYKPNHPYTRAHMRAASSFMCAYAHSRSHTGPSAVQATPHMECWMGSGQAHRAHCERGSAGRHAVYVGSGRNYDARSDA
jgi:hypothetical protein